MEEKSKQKETTESKEKKIKLNPKIIAIAFISLLLLFILCICSLIGFGLYKGIGSKNVITERRAVKEFTKIELDTPGTIYFTQGDVLEVKIEGEDNIVPYIITEVKNDTLNIRLKRRFPPVLRYFPREDIKYFITAPNLESIKINGSGDFESDNIQASTFDINIFGSGNVKLYVEAFQLNVTIDGSGGLVINGDAKNQDITINGSGGINGNGFLSQSSVVVINGSGDVYVEPEKLDVTINGSGNVYYLGDPEITQEINGSGKVEKYN